MEKFELEHKASHFGKHVLIRMLKGYIKAYLFFGILFIVCFGLYYYSKNYLGTVIPYTKMGFQVAFFGMLIGPFMPLISYLQRNKKYPSYGLNKDGFLLNERGWDAAHFGWDEIKDLKEFEHPKFGKELHFEFVNFTRAMNKDGQEKFAQAINREYVTQKHPKKISPELVRGDLTEFIQKFQEYYNTYKADNPISAIEAYELGTAYSKKLHLGYRISQKVYEKLDAVDGLQGAFFAFPVEDLKSLKFLVSIDRQQVDGIMKRDKMTYPHKVKNNLTIEEAKEIVESHLGNGLKDTKIKHAYFHYLGILEHPDPCWIVYTKNLKATLDGTKYTDYVINAETKIVETSLTS